MKTEIKKTSILLGVATVFALSSWAIQTRAAEGWFTDEQKKTCEKNGTFVQIGNYASYGTCVCDLGFVGFLCDQQPPN